MNRSKIVAIITGAISIILAIAYLILVQLLDYRDMQPAPISQVDHAAAIAMHSKVLRSHRVGETPRSYLST